MVIEDKLFGYSGVYDFHHLFHHLFHTLFSQTWYGFSRFFMGKVTRYTARAITPIGTPSMPDLIVQLGIKLIQCVHSILAVFSSTASCLLAELARSLWYILHFLKTA